MVDKPQVINGQQTTRTLHNISGQSGSVLVKVIKIPRKASDDEDYDNLVNQIVKATNWQNHIENSDLRSNDLRQIQIERSLRRMGYLYVRKKMSKSEAAQLFPEQKYQTVSKFNAATVVAATIYDPSLLRKGKETFFEDEYYDSVFPTSSGPYYLSRYYLLKQIEFQARGNSDMGFAKWLVLHFLWKRLSHMISYGSGEEKFRLAWDRKIQVIQGKIEKLVLFVLEKAVSFYKSNRRKPSFLKRQKVPEGKKTEALHFCQLLQAHQA